MARRNNRNDVDITREELHRISEALKQEEFRKLFIDYVDEINDPKNKALYEKELTQYERERGIEVTFIHPKPGYVIKTSVDGSKKAFINVCVNDKIGKPYATRGVQEGSSGTEWSLPYIQAPPRDDLDKNRKLCVVYDVIFHPLTLELAKKDQRIKTFVNDTALAAVENSFEVTLDRNNFKFPKMGFMGYKHPCVIRKKVNGEPSEESLDNFIPNPHYPYSEPVSEPAVFNLKQEPRGIDEYTVPKYHIKHRKNLDFEEFTLSNDAKLNTCVAHELLIEINLPLIRSTSDIELMLSEKTLTLKSESPAKYKLEINLPYCVIDNESSAKFDGSTRKLMVTAIVDRQKHCLTKEDSGLESDPSRGMTSSSDEDITKLDQENPVITNVTENAVSHINIDQKNGVGDKEDFLTMDSQEDMDIDVVEPFLNPDTYYSLPSYALHQISNNIIADLTVKNVEPSSISYIFSENNSQFQIKFYSMGSGFVPINYTVCLKLNSSSFEPVTLNTDVFDNSVSFSIALSKGNWLGIVHFGREPSDLQEVTLLDSNSSSEVPSKAVTNFLNQGTRKQTGDIILKLSKLRLYSTADDDSDDYDCEEEEEVSEKSTPENSAIMSNNSTKINNTSSLPTTIEKKIRRTHSESGCAIPLIQRRSILKDTRSLSESNANDYTGFSLSMDSEDGCGPTENGNVKKHVRFSETISKKVFRSNSSILGQRKKNQRKARNKKRSLERRNSESSGISESDVSELEVSEVSDLSEVSDVSETSESDDGSTVEKTVPQTPGSKAHRRKGKKNHRKSANTAKINCLFDNDA